MTLDLDPATRQENIARVVSERAEMATETAHLGAELATMLERAAGEAQSQGGVFAAVYSTVSEGRPVGASVVVSLIPGRRPLDASLSGDPRRVLAEGLRERYAGPDTDTSVVDLPPGPAARVRRRLRMEVPLGAGQPAAGAEVEQVQFFVPLPSASHIALLTFSTPNVGLAEPFNQLFEAIAGTLTWT
jgi:hypothetical protein